MLEQETRRVPVFRIWVHRKGLAADLPKANRKVWLGRVPFDKNKNPDTQFGHLDFWYTRRDSKH